MVLSIPARPSEEDNGLLTASEVATLKLNADFVVLSACNTAAGDKPDAEALSGLARAFFYAGQDPLSFRIGMSIAKLQSRSWTGYLERLRQIPVFRTPKLSDCRCCE